MQIFKNKKIGMWIRLILFLVGVWGINRILIFCLVPAITYTRWAGHEIASEDKQYGVIAFGSSEMLRCWDTVVAEDILGISTFNYGGNTTYLTGGIYASFQNAMAYQHPEYVVIMPGTYTMFPTDKEHTTGYISTALYMEDTISRWKYFFRVSGDGGAVRRLFLWPGYSASSWEDIRDNIYTRRSEAYKNYDSTILGNYRGNGYWVAGTLQEAGFGKDSVCDYRFDKRESGAFDDQEKLFHQTEMTVLDKMVSYCKKNDIKVILISQPLPITSIYSRPFYASYSSQLDQYAKDRNVIFWDLNLAKSDFIERDIDNFYDVSHVNENGAKIYTTAVCDLIQKTERGEDVSNLFYSDWDEYLQSIDEIVAVYTLFREKDGKSYLSAHSVTGTLVTPQYRFVLREAESGEEVILQDYSEENKYVIPDGAMSGQMIRVYARVAGAGEEAEARYYDYVIK